MTDTSESNPKTTCRFCGESILAIARKCKHCGSMLEGEYEVSPASEAIVADVAANLFRGIEGVGGRLKITNRRVLFEPHAINIQRNPAEIPIVDIAEVSTRNTLGIIPNGMLIRTRAGVEYKFVVWGRDRLISLIEDQRARR